MQKFFLRNKAFLIFGMMFVFFSAPGQTFLMSLFFDPMFQEAGVSKSTFAATYSGATLAAALLLNPVGQIIDRYKPRKIILWLTVLMAIGCCVLSLASHLWTFFLGFFMVRWIGQGAYGVTAVTLTTKAFHRNRGKALGLINQGLPLSEILYPPLAIALLHTTGWRWTFVIFGLMNVAIMFPLQRILLKRSPYKHNEFFPGELDPDPNIKHRVPRDHTIRDMLKDPKCYLILIPCCFPTMIVAGIFFHQSTLMISNHWSLGLAAWALFYYAIFKAAASLLIGPYIDRQGPVTPLVWMIFTLGLSAMVAGLGHHPWLMCISYALSGISLGLSAPACNAVWPHFYGTRHIGQIKGFYDTVRNSFTSLSPLVMALGLDAGHSIQNILLVMGAITLIIAVFPIILLQQHKNNVISSTARNP